MNYDDLLRELKMEAVLFPDISAEDLADIIHALENHFCNATIDAEPVRHGHWVHGKELSRDYIGDVCVNIYYDKSWCSECNYTTEWHSLRALSNYCPNCGAKMDDAYNSPSPNPQP